MNTASNRLEPHDIIRTLCELGLSTLSDFELFSPSTRDRADVAVYRCRRSEVLVLSTTRHMSLVHYEEKGEFIFGQNDERKDAVIASIDDSERRMRTLRPLVLGKRWLDVGTGHGGVLDLLAPFARATAGVEPQRKARSALLGAGYRVYADLAEVDETYDVVTLFHVFEHLCDPFGFLRSLKRVMAPGAVLIIEVPHARDFLFRTLECEEFRKFTLWSEHLILHTRSSLLAFARGAGFSRCEISGVQRYPIANHLYWLAKARPGGHKTWAHLRDGILDAAYEAKLTTLDETDTLVAQMLI